MSVWLDMLIRSLHDSPYRIFELASHSRRGNRVGYAMPYVYQPSTQGYIMAMRNAKASTLNVTTEIQEEGIFDLALVLVMDNAANGGVSMKFEGNDKHKWFNNRMQSDAALNQLDTVADALGLATWDSDNAVESFTKAIGVVCRVQIVSKRSNGVTYYNVAKFSKVEAKAATKPAAKSTRTAKPATDDDIPF